MAKYTIYGVGHTAQNPIIRYEGAPTYHGTYLKPSYLELPSIASPTLIDWHIGDYIIYNRTGYTYKLYEIPQPTKKAVSDGSGEAYVYSNVQFYCATKELEICPFRDLVYKDSAYHFSTLNSVNTYENVAGIAGRIKANLINLFGNTWNVVVASGLSGFDETEAREFSLSGGNCLSALDKIYEVWPDLGWTFSIVNGVYTITIGGANVRSSDNTTNKFEYGKTKGLTMIKKTQANRDDFCTRLYVYGSNRNILSRYYNDLLDENQQHIYQYESVHIPNLMLPLSSWGKTSGKYDASKAYLENSTAQATYGIIPKTVYFDGSEDEEIFPSIKGCTIKNLRDAKSSTSTGAPNYYPDTTIYTNPNARIDEIVEASSPSDDGDFGSSGKKYIEEYSETVNATTHSIEVPASGGEAIVTNTVNNVLSHTFTNTGKVNISTECAFRITSQVAPSSIVVTCIVKNGDEIITSFPLTSYTTSGNDYLYNIGPITAGSESKLLTGNVSVSISFNITYTSVATAFTLTYGKTSANVSWGMSKVLTKTFSATIRQIGFDMMARAALSGNGNPSIAFTDGACVGREFVVKSATYNSISDNWKLELYRGDDTSISMRFPNTNYPIASGNHFVILNIAMPDEYVGMAASRLLTKGTALLQKNSRVEPFFEPSVDAKVVAENIAAHPSGTDPDAEKYILREGKYMYITDSDVVLTDEYVIIDTLTISENESNIPTYKVTLRERKKQSFKQSIESSLSSMTSTSSGSSTSSTGGSGGGVSDYNELDNLPAIDAKTLRGAMSAYDDLKLITRDLFEIDDTSIPGKRLIHAKLDGLYSDGQISAGGAGSGGSGGTTDYTQLTNKPSINGITLTGNKTSTDLGIFVLPNTTGATDKYLKWDGSAAVWADGGGGGSEPSAYLKSASVSGNTLTLTKKDNTTVDFSAQPVIDSSHKLSSDLVDDSNSDANKFVTSSQKASLSELIEMFTRESDGNGGYRIKANYGLYSNSFITAGGLGSGSASSTAWGTKVGNTRVLSVGATSEQLILYPSGTTGHFLKKTSDGVEWAAVNGEPDAYIKNASVSGRTLTLTKKDNSTVSFSAQAIIDDNNKLSSDLVDDSNSSTNKFITASQKASLADLISMFEFATHSGVQYIKTTFRFYSTESISAGGVGSGTAGGTDYSLLINKPSINSVTLNGNKSLSDLGIAAASHSHVTTDITDLETWISNKNYITNPSGTVGHFLKKTASGVEWAAVSGGTSDFESLSNRPKYNGSYMSGSTDIPQVKTSTWDAKANVSDIPTALSELSADSTHRLVTDSDKTYWNGKADTSDIPTALSDLSSDSTHRLVTDSNKTYWNGKQDALGYTPLDEDDFTFSNIGGSLSASQVPNLSWNKITSDKPTTLSGYGITDALTSTEISASYQSKISTTNKISADCISETSTEKIMTSAERTKLAGLNNLIKNDGASNAVNNIVVCSGSYSGSDANTLYILI